MTQEGTDVLSEADVRRIVAAGENEDAEFKLGLMPANRLSRIVSGFANANGGMLLMGVEETGRFAGVVETEIREAVDRAVSLMEPRPEVSLNIVPCSGKDIAAIRVKKSDKIVIAEDGAFVRTGATTKAMTRSELSDRFSASSEEPSISQLVDAVARQTNTIERLRNQLSESNSFANKMMDYLVGGIIGALLGAALGALLG